MKQLKFHPSYIPRKWIHYADHSKKKRIRKKYQNRIRQTISQRTPVIESISIPENNALLIDYEPRVEIPGDIQRLNDAFEELEVALRTALEPVIEAIHKIIDKFTKWARNLFDSIWRNNRRWWNMAEHHKKYRIRKKYRNKIKHMARQRLSELLRSLKSDDSENQDDASDDKEVN